MSKDLFLISHTHWDREWYSTFQHYRRRLVRMIDDLLDCMESDSAYVCFHMDGQTIMLEDYLDIRPENKPRLKVLIEAGRLFIGPWYTMPDEFLVSGESLVRNLQKGHQICGEWGAPALKSGYVTDIFGHNSQFPQILKGFDINNAILFRGVGDYPKDTFMWEGADGTQTVTAKLDKNRSYSNFYFAIRWPFDGGREYNDDELVKRMEELLKYCDIEATSDALLMMDGVDHIDCEPRLPAITKMLEERIEGIKFKHCSIEEYFERKLADGGLDVVAGALYNVGKEGINNMVLKNVLSSHVELKQANDKCERLLTAFSEPLDAATGMLELDTPPRYRSMEPRKGFIDKAWEYVLKNHPHDSICGCSLSDVHNDNIYRFRQAEQLSELVTEDCLQMLAYNTDTTGTGKSGAVYLYNPSQRDACGIRVFELPVPTGHQMNLRFYDALGEVAPFQILNMRRQLKPTAPMRELITFPMFDYFTVAMPVDIPGNGYSVYTYDSLITHGPGEGDYLFREYHAPKRFLGSMRTGINSFDTGAIEVEVNPNGTLDVTDKKTGAVYKQLLALEDCGDCGEGWNYVKPQFDREFVTTCGTADFAILSDGPLAARFRIRHTISLPEERGLDPMTCRSDSHRANICEITVTLTRDSGEIQVETRLENISDDHRLRVLMPLAFKADHFFAKTPFDMQKWSPDYEKTGEYREIDTKVYTGQGIAFAQSGKDGLSVYTRGLLEFELNKEASMLALTLMRVFPIETNSEFKDKNEFRQEFCGEFALNIGATDEASAAICGEGWRNGIKTVHSDCSSGKLPASGSFLKLTGDAMLSSFKRGGNGFDVRIYNVTNKTIEGTLELINAPKSAAAVDFLGKPIESLKVSGKSADYRLSPKQIMTVHIELS